MAAGGAAAAARAMGGSGARGRRVLCSSQTTAVHQAAADVPSASTCTASWSEHPRPRGVCVWGVAAGGV